MKSARRVKKVIALLTLFVLAIGMPVLAATGSLDLTWFTIDGGGGASSGGGYQLIGSLGQPDAGRLAGGAYTLSGGFWGDATEQYAIFLPLVMRQ